MIVFMVVVVVVAVIIVVFGGGGGGDRLTRVLKRSFRLFFFIISHFVEKFYL